MGLINNDIIFRVDAGSNIGSGHVVRCLALAFEFQARGGRPHFICGNSLGSLADTIVTAGFELELLPNGIGWDEDLDRTLYFASACGAKGVVVDHYGIGDDYLGTIHKKGLMVAAIDDIADHPFPVDVLINQNPNARELDYITREDTLQLLGLDYALLRPEFCLARNNLNREIGPVRNLLVTLGGSDLHHLTLQVLEALDSISSPISFHVVAGSLSPDLDKIRAWIDNSTTKKFRLSVDASAGEMATSMAEADLAIHAAGSTFWELCCLGLPSVSIVVAANQKGIAQTMSELDATRCLGWHERLKPDTIRIAVEELISDRKSRKVMAEKMMGLVDGRGAKRVAAALIQRLEMVNP